MKLSQFRLAGEMDRLKKELDKKGYFDLDYVQKHYDKKLIDQLSKKGLLLKTFLKIYPK